MRGYMSKKRAKVKATFPPSPDEEEEVDATADPPPSSPEQQDAETTAVDALMALTKTKQSSKRFKGMNFTKMARELISKDKDWKENTRPLANCEENCSMQIECNNYCQGGEGCSNKCIQKGEVKNVRKGQRGEKGFGLFAGEDIQEGEYVIEYIGKIVPNDPNNEYTMMYKEFNLWVNASKSDTLAKFINHSCNPNCVNKMWAIKGMPGLCFLQTGTSLKEKKSHSVTAGHYWQRIWIEAQEQCAYAGMILALKQSKRQKSNS